MLRLGFVGIGGYPLNNLRGFLPMEQEGLVRIVALADPSAPALKVAQELCPAARVFAHYADLLDQVELDAIVISTPIPFHEEMALTAMKRGLFLFLEKPPVPLLSQLRRLLASEGSDRVMVGFQHMYSSALREAKELILGGRLGEVRRMFSYGIWPRGAEYYNRASWAGKLSLGLRPVLDGPCTNACSHFINDLLYLGGGSLESFAMPSWIRGELYRARPIPSYDTGSISGVLEEGQVEIFAAYSHASDVLKAVDLEVVGTRGSLSIRSDGKFLVRPDGSTRDQPDAGRIAMWRAFVAFAMGEVEANLTPLRAMTSYVTATNLMFQSSAGIESIPSHLFQIQNQPSANDQYVIPDLPTVAEKAAKTGCSLAEAGAKWARETGPVLLADFSEARFLADLGLPQPSPHPDVMAA